MNSRTHGFTLIELLVVIAIMATLAGMVIALIGPIQLRAKLTATSVKMQGVLDGLATKGQQEGSAVYALQVQTLPWTGSVATDPEAGLRGVRTFSINPMDQLPMPKSPSDWGLPIAAQPPYTRILYPWGKEWVDAAGMKQPPTAMKLREISVFNTRKLLYAAGTITLDKTTSPAFKQYLTDRGENQPWNDRWGRPLVVGSVLYQPDNGREVAEALKRYQYNRSLYVAVAAVGPKARITAAKLSSGNEGDWIGATGVLQSIWDQANAVCQQAKVAPFDTDWTEKSFDSRAWEGIKVGHKNKAKHDMDKNSDPTYISGADEHCLLSIPTELK